MQVALQAAWQAGQYPVAARCQHPATQEAQCSRNIDPAARCDTLSCCKPHQAAVEAEGALLTQDGHELGCQRPACALLLDHDQLCGAAHRSRHCSRPCSSSQTP